MAYLDAEKISMSVLNKSGLGGNQPVKIQLVPNMEVAGVKFKPQQEFANSDNCVICKQPFNPAKNINKHHCRICASSCCGECSRKKVNNERVCDFCFLKQYLKKQSHERKEMLKAREQTIEKLTQQTKENEAKIDKLDVQIAKLEQSNIALEMQQSKSIRQLEAKVKSMQEKYKSRQEALNQRKTALEQRHKQLLGRQQKNKVFAQKVQMLKLDISCKQISQLQKMEELERLKVQLQNLEKQKKEVMKDLKP